MSAPEFLEEFDALGDTAAHPLTHRLAQFRAKAGLSRREVAKAVGTSRQTIHRIEVGHQQPSWPLAAKLIEISGGRLSADDFMPKAEAAE